MLLLAAIFLLPIILAKVALETEFFNKAATNKGELLTPPIEYPEVLKREHPVWRLVFVLPEECNNACENSLYSLNQVWQALGKEQDRAEATILFTNNSDAQALDKVNDNGHFLVLPVDPDTLKQRFSEHSLMDVYVADTLGNIILSYQITSDQEQAVMKSRDILSDLKKLLKLSRIG